MCDIKAYLMPTGTLYEFSFMDDCCEVRLLPCTEITFPSNGFLRDDYFLVRLDIRVKQKDNELCKVIVDGKTATCQVCFLCSSMHRLTLKLELSGSRDS